MKQLITFCVLLFLSFGALSAQENGVLTSVGASETKIESYSPKVYGGVKAKYEVSMYDRDYRFNVRNSRIGVKGNASSAMRYAVQIDFNNEGKVNILDSYVAMNYKKLEFIIGQQQYHFTTELDRGPTTNYFANRSFLAKFITMYYDDDAMTVSSVGSRDIGALVRYELTDDIRFNVGLFNGNGINTSEWTSSVSGVLRLDLGDFSEGLSGGLSHYNGSTPTIYVDQDSYTHRQKIKMWGAELNYGNKYYRVESEYAMRRVNDLNENVIQAALIQGFYMFYMPEGSYAHYISPIGRYDFGDGIEYINKLSKQIDRFYTQRLSLGVNIGFVSKLTTSEIKINYEKYIFNDKPTDYVANPLFQDKITVEFVAAF